MEIETGVVPRRVAYLRCYRREINRLNYLTKQGKFLFNRLIAISYPSREIRTRGSCLPVGWLFWINNMRLSFEFSFLVTVS